MNCLDFRRQSLSEPNTDNHTWHLHKRECAECHRFAKEVVQLDKSIVAEISEEMPADLSARIKLRQTMHADRQQRRRPWMVAMAASVIAIVLVGGSFGANLYKRNIQAENFRVSAIDYVMEQKHLLAVDNKISHDTLQRFVAAFGGKLTEPITGVRLAEACPVREHAAAHLIVNGKRGPITVIYSAHTPIRAATTMTKDGWRALHVPAGAGSMTLIAEHDEPLNPLVEKISQSISWN